MIILWILIALTGCILGISYYCYKETFAVPHYKGDPITVRLPQSEQYKDYVDIIESRARALQSVPYEDVYITSYDGLKLHGRYYFISDDAPLEIEFHGYRSIPEIDFGTGQPYAIKAGRNVLLIDQRAHGESEGKCLTFGIKERFDCQSWVQYATNRFGADKTIYLMGISMGAATVMMASSLPMPNNVKCILADCGYSSPALIIKNEIKNRHLPVALAFPFVRLGGWLFGGFDVNEYSALEAVKNTQIPILFIHGEDDRYVPFEMSVACYEACSSPKKDILTVPGAPHGMSFFLNEKEYIEKENRFYYDETTPLVK